MSEPNTPTPGRRASITPRRKVDILVALAIGLPAVVALSVAVIGNESDPIAGISPPTTSDLTSATTVCPSAISSDASTVRVGRTPGVTGGELQVLTGKRPATTVADAAPVTAAQDATVVVPGSSGATVVDGSGAAAPGLIAGRSDALAVPECRAPSYDEWLVGLGASARYSTTLELVNPDDGEAVVDLALYDAAGPVDEPALRGVQVPAHGVRRIDLSQSAPRRTLTAAHLTVIRGRVTAAARTTRDPLGRARATTDFLPTQAEPSARNLILGFPAKPQAATLFLANPGKDEVRANIRLVTADATFTPTGAKEIPVAPQSMATVDLGPLLAGEAGNGVLGIVVDAPEALAASVRMLSAGDLTLLAPVIDTREVTAAVVPEGAKTLQLGDADRSGVIHVTSYDATGAKIAEEQVEIEPDRAASLALPPKAVRITVEPRNTRIAGVVDVPTGGRLPGLATLRLRPAETHARIPVVAPQ
ncbi:hypothetical protein GCM10022237_38980 [Nocardioides ginsengisoli]|uniref:DUF5719 family protein n=1 Tax=Nocardioides ginsengisoli TaxID=363868 RepID=A0ABW3VY67_9ACTN